MEIEDRVLVCVVPRWGKCPIRTSKKSSDNPQVADVTKKRGKFVMKKKVLKVVPLLVLMVLILGGCATRIRFEAPRTPNLDTTGIQRIAVVPFTTTIGGGASQIAQELTSEVTSRLQATNAFTLVSHDTVRAVQARGGSIEPYVDALFRGRITHYAARTTPEQVQLQYRRGDGTIGTQMVTVHTREVEVAFEYYFVRARDGSMIGPIRRTGRTSASCGGTGVGNLPAESALAMNIVRNQLNLFYRDVAPHTIVLTRTMEREPDRALRPMMNAADARRQAGDYLGAREAYVAIWESHRSIAAAINAAILYEATGDLEGGIFFIAQVFEATRAPQVNHKLAQLSREAAYVLGLEAFDDIQAPAERVARHAVGEILSVLPPRPRLWIQPTTTDFALVNDVIDNMVTAFSGAGVTIVERQRTDVILAEHNLHLGGAVADDYFISIGSFVGANAIIFVDVIGTGAARRLQVRVLDIETTIEKMRSDTGVAWRL